MKDVERLWASGHALGSSLENSVVISDEDQVINSGGLRFSDEFVRHKTLDAVGDLALAKHQSRAGGLLQANSSQRQRRRLTPLGLSEVDYSIFRPQIGWISSREDCVDAGLSVNT